MLESEDDEATATERIVDRKTGETVGLIYAWEDGVRQPHWFEGAKEEVVTVRLIEPKQR